MKISNKLLEESVVYLENYIRNKKLSKNKRLAIRKIIIQRKIENRKLAEEMIQTPLYKLASTNLVKQGKFTQLKIGTYIEYVVESNTLLLRMLEIVNKACIRGLRQELNEYIG